MVFGKDLIIFQTALDGFNKNATEISLEINTITTKVPITPDSHAN